jgi:dihydroorotate dehydrogenase
LRGGLDLYRLARPLLFSLDPELAHQVGLGLATFLPQAALPACPVRAMGLEFPNPVGLAAGLDKDAVHIDALARLGFGFIEVGTVTPRPQPGNPRPRLFRIPQKEALVNRFGFNNAGIHAFVAAIERTQWRGVLGVNIGRNADTPAERAVDDYELCLRQVYPVASYVTINVSSPLSAARENLSTRHGKRVPLVLKIAPDLGREELAAIADSVRRHRLEGVIATNTSVSRDGVKGLRHGDEAGGLSGRPIRNRATTVLKLLKELLPDTTLIGAGGILSGGDAAEKFAAGAQLVQLYTGLIYRGPGLVGECVSAYRGK